MSESTTVSRESRHGGQTGGSTGTGSRLTTAVRYVRKSASSGLLAGVAGATNLLRAGQALRNESGRNAGRYGLMGAFWVAVAAMQRQSNRGGHAKQVGGVDQTDVVHTAPDIEDVSSGSQSGESGGGTSIDVTDTRSGSSGEGSASTADVDQRDVVDTEPDIEDVEEADGVEDPQDAEGMERVDDAEGVTDLSESDEATHSDEAADSDESTE